MPNFSKAKIGDKVYDLLWGEGKVVDVRRGYKYPILCEFKREEETFTESFLFDGRLYDTAVNATLYHSKPEISDPPPPKRMVKKSGWLNIYPPHFSKDPVVSFHGYKEDAEYNQTKNLIACIPIEWEEEES